jgi:hypothetical protein
MALFTQEESIEAFRKILTAIGPLGYTALPTEAGDGYHHSYVVETEKTRKVLKFRLGAEKIDVFHGEFILSTGSRTLNTWYIQSQQKLEKVLGKLASA